MQLDNALIGEIENNILLGYISKQKHPSADIWILNYTKKTQYEWMWTSSTTICRGLIVDCDWNIVAMAYPKFFSFEQIIDKSEIPIHEKAHVYDKSDGSLGIMYFIDGKPFIATRGSFASEMAIEANKMLETTYSSVKWNPAYSYVFEIIYPENRIVVDYGDTRELVLHGIYHNETAKEIPLFEFSDYEYLRDAGVTMIREFDIGESLDGFVKLINDYPYDGREGFVVRFESGYRVKIKYDEYKNLSFIKDQTSDKKLLELIINGTVMDILDSMPEETQKRVLAYDKMVRECYTKIENEYYHEVTQIRLELYHKSVSALTDKKLIAELIMNQKHRLNTSLLFSIVNGQANNITRDIWKMVKQKLEV